MNADFEVELSQHAGAYRRLPAFEALNHRLSKHLLWLASKGDALLVKEPWGDELRREAFERGVELFAPSASMQLVDYDFKPWGWTESAVRAGREAGAKLSHVPLEVVRRVNSKLWSHALEVELGWEIKGAATASTLEELQDVVARACPLPDDKWVIKSPFGFAARDRVLGRGPRLDLPQARWSERRILRGETLVFQPWLEVVREYGVVMEISKAGSHTIFGVSDLQTNGAGTGKGYILGRRPSRERMEELERIASVVASRLFAEGYYGAVGIDALEHRNGLHPLLEINARYTMGFVAVAVERSLKPATEMFWKT
jgi:hypothetical protein